MPNKDFGVIKSNVGDEVGDTSSAFATRLGVYINNRYDDILDRLKSHNLFEAFRSFTASTTASTRDYVTPYDFDEPVYAIDESNNRVLDIINEEEWVQRFGNNPNTTGAPIVLVKKAASNVRAQPASASTLKAVSSNGNDTTQTMVIKAISGSAEFYETVTLNGTASAVSTNTYDYILKLGLDAAASGAVTITYVTGGDTAAVISPDNTEARYKRVGFHYVPAGEYDINVRFKRKVAPLVNTDDHPLLDVAEGIELGAKADAWRTKRFFGNAADFETLYERWLDRYIQQRISGQVHQFDIRPTDRDETYG